MHLAPSEAPHQGSDSLEQLMVILTVSVVRLPVHAAHLRRHPVLEALRNQCAVLQWPYSSRPDTRLSSACRRQRLLLLTHHHVDAACHFDAQDVIWKRNWLHAASDSLKPRPLQGVKGIRLDARRHLAHLAITVRLAYLSNKQSTYRTQTQVMHSMCSCSTRSTMPIAQHTLNWHQKLTQLQQHQSLNPSHLAPPRLTNHQAPTQLSAAGCCCCCCCSPSA
jgi:hypothetical protein